jgi:ABC-type siderophore export system fused ATPase/permease subunit
VKILVDNIDTTKRNTQTLIDASKEVGLELNAEKTKYMFLSLHQNAGQIHDRSIANRYFENVAQLKYLGRTATNQNFIRRK